MSTSQACFVFSPQCGSHLLSIGTLLPGIEVNEVSLVPLDCNSGKNKKIIRNK